MIQDDLPDEIKTFLQRHILHEQSLAYLRVSSSGVLIDCGGRLETFGLSGIKPGIGVDEQVDFLAGMLPLEGFSSFLDFVEMQPGTIAQVHFFSAKGDDWVVLLDASVEENQHRMLQQKANELVLARHREQKLLDELAAKNRALTELNEFKNELLGTAAHDLRSPISVARLCVDFLLMDLSDSLSQKQMRFLRKIADASIHMEEMLNDVLDISAIESGKLSIRRESTNFVEFLRDVIEFNTPLAEKRGIRLTATLPETLPDIAIDRRKIEQVLNNLISNGLKYSPRDTAITLSVEILEGFLEIQVHDEGYGIPVEELDKLFKPFSRTTVRPVDGESSTGLGLAICKRIVEGHGGSITVESIVGHGSNFSFVLPLSP